ncbi:hypothetical protein MTO96_051612 [Rhipicephalus appendiculatus]
MRPDDILWLGPWMHGRARALSPATRGHTFHVYLWDLATGAFRLDSFTTLASFETCQPPLNRSATRRRRESPSRIFRSSVLQASVATTRRCRPTRRQTFRNSSPFSRRRNRKLIKMSVGATFPETRRDNRPVFRRFSWSQLSTTPATTPSDNLKPWPSSGSAKPSGRKEGEEGASEVIATVDDLVVDEKPEPEVLGDSDGVVRKAREVREVLPVNCTSEKHGFLKYVLCLSLQARLVRDGQQLASLGPAFETYAPRGFLRLRLLPAHLR